MAALSNDFPLDTEFYRFMAVRTSKESLPDR